MDEQKKYEVIKSLADHPTSNKDRAALELGVTRRHINRLLVGYRKFGKAFFIHGNRGRKPVSTIPSKTRQLVVDLYRTKYYDANFRHYTELLKQHEQIVLSVSSVSAILEHSGILSPKATKAKKKRMKQLLKQKQDAAMSLREQASLQTNLVALEAAHPRRPRCAYFGELQQMDASPHEWVPGHIWHLHLAIDDALGMVTGAYFDTQETLSGYYHVLHQMVSSYGIPYQIRTDNRSVFIYTQKKSPSTDEDSYTQFAYACKQLGILLETTSIPQTKGRVERLNQTLQSRLPVELRLAGITTIEAANEFLNSYIKEFNTQFSLPLYGTRSVFEMQPTPEKLNQILAVLQERTIDCGHCIQFQRQYYRLLTAQGQPVHYRKGTKVMVIRAFDGALYGCVNDRDVYRLDAIPKRYTTSKEFDIQPDLPAVKPTYIPPMSHPWKQASFQRFIRKQPHRRDLSADACMAHVTP